MKPNYLELTPGDLERVNRSRAKNERSLKIDSEQLFIAEFGKHYGWGGVAAILNNEIDGETATWLLQAARKIDNRYSFEYTKAVLIGVGSAQSKKPSQVFKKATADLVKNMEADA